MLDAIRIPAVLVGIATGVLAGCGGSTATSSAVEPATPSEAESTPEPPLRGEVCGLALPCSSPTVDNPHDLYGAMVVAFSEHGAALVSEGSAADCIACSDPQAFFGSLLADPGGHKGALAHVYLSLKEAAREAFKGREMQPLDSLWAELHDWTATMLEKARELEEPPPCLLLTAHCTSDPAFIDAFVSFLEEVLSREPLDADPGFQKEHAVKLALAANPPGGLEVIIRFIKTGAEVRARAKAVRDICAYAPHLEEAREALEWVVANDRNLADRARRCLFELSAQ